MYQRLWTAFLFGSLYGTLVRSSLARDAYDQIMRLSEIAAHPDIAQNPELVFKNADHREQIQRCLEVARELTLEISPSQIDIPALVDDGSNRKIVAAQLTAVAGSLQCGDDDHTEKLIQTGLDVLQLLLYKFPKRALAKIRNSPGSVYLHHVRCLLVKDLRSSIHATLDIMMKEVPIPNRKLGFQHFDITANHSEEVQTQINLAVGLAKDAFGHLDYNQFQVPQFIEMSETGREEVKKQLLSMGATIQNFGGIGPKLWNVFQPLGFIVLGFINEAKSQLLASEGK
jgi:hypothetical protein